MKDLLGMVRNVIRVPQEDMDDYDDEGYYEEDRRYTEYRQPAYDPYDERNRRVNAIAERNKVVDMPSDLNDMKVAVHKPAKYNDARVICDKLKAFAPVVVNLEKLDRDEAQRVVDFIMGACYTMDGHVDEIKEDVFLVAPSMINIEKEFDSDTAIKANSFFSKFTLK